jgi:hypothetical protein
LLPDLLERAGLDDEDAALAEVLDAVVGDVPGSAHHMHEER